ncbi:unnamed protein product [Caenorhabditis angaria]|uniref:Lon protease homolog n=1 Tax=Caenorhabditis angaria TaxID=860376 RepID=A0A9P1N0D5_9PELO|nr:unnamed protein product [Caenorhabditis angaria]
MKSSELPVLLISNGVLLPGADLKIPIKNRNNILTIEKYLTKSTGIQNQVVVAYKLSTEKVYEIATVAYVDKIFGWTFNNVVQYSIHVVGLHRATIQKLSLPTCIISKIEEPSAILEHSQLEILLKSAKYIAENSTNERISFDIYNLMEEKEYGRLTDLCVSQLKQQNDVGYAQLLEYLTILEIDKRVELLEKWTKTRKSLKISAENLNIDDIQTKMSGAKQNLRPRKIPNSKNSIEVLEEKLNAIEFPENVTDRVFSELARLKSLNSSQSEYNILVGWLELVAALPWKTSTIDEIEISKARRYLDESHDAMNDVKQRVLEHLAVCKMNESVRGMILCFTGPPGIGKTSIAKAIAQSMGRKFERISLGGIRDESDIRGHRRTYVAAMPGRIIEALKHAKTDNPVFLLDEIDKLYSGNQGSPSAALLELLDPEQNKEFHDHYLNIPFDVSKIMFIATANDISNIEPALRDRLEIIEMSGYTLKEKTKICQNHLLPRQLSKHCISPDYVNLDQRAIVTMIEEYTMEAGVRQLERNISAICRNVALKLAEALNSDLGADTLPEFELPINISEPQVHQILKTKQAKRIRIVERMSPLQPGTVFGLSVTTNGGRVMPIEASKSEGKGKIVTTGHLGKVLEESILVAKGWLAANSERLNIKSLKDFDVHVHLPAGSINKDGPSAGTGLACSLVSLAMDVPIRSDAAITGEISLTGHVLPIGGVKEKVLAAQRDGLRRVVLPRSNYEEVEKLDSDLKNEIEIVLVDTIEEAIDAMIRKSPVLAKL